MNTERAGVFLKQYYLGCLPPAPYLIADKASGTTSASIVSMLVK